MAGRGGNLPQNFIRSYCKKPWVLIVSHTIIKHRGRANMLCVCSWAPQHWPKAGGRPDWVIWVPQKLQCWAYVPLAAACRSPWPSTYPNPSNSRGFGFVTNPQTHCSDNIAIARSLPMPREPTGRLWGRKEETKAGDGCRVAELQLVPELLFWPPLMGLTLMDIQHWMELIENLFILAAPCFFWNCLLL